MRHAPSLNLSCIKMHVTRKSVNHVPWLNHSCYEGIANHVSEFIIRATSCTLRGNRESRTVVESFMQQVARYEGKNLTDFKYNIFLFRTKIRFSHNRYYNIFMRSTAIRISRFLHRTRNVDIGSGTGNNESILII